MGLGKAGCELQLCCRLGHIVRAMGNRCGSGEPPETATNGGAEQEELGKGLERSKAATLQKPGWGRVWATAWQTQQAPPSPETATH